jgi:hypothetical protein
LAPFLPELAAVRVIEGFVLYRSYPWMLGPLLALAVALAATDALGVAGHVPGVCGPAAIAHEQLATFRSRRRG